MNKLTNRALMKLFDEAILIPHLMSDVMGYLPGDLTGENEFVKSDITNSIGLIKNIST